MRTYEASAKTYDEAVNNGLAALGVSISDVTIETLEEGSKGLFGLFGSRNYKVRLTVKDDGSDDLLDLLSDKPKARKPEKPAAPKADPKPEKKPERKPEAKAEKPVKKAEPKPEKPAEPKPEKKTEPKAEAPAEAVVEEKTEASEKPARKPRNRKPRGERAEKAVDKQAEKTEKKPLPPKAPVKPIEKPVITELTAEQLTEETAAGKAVAFLKELTGLMGVTVDMTAGADEEGNVFVSMTGDAQGILIGRHGETLDALQYLTSLRVNRGQEGYTRVTLDAENYRAKREDTLIRLANRMANKAVKTGRKVSLEPMNPYERRIIHSALQANEAVDTHSEGEEPNRHIVITLRK